MAEKKNISKSELARLCGVSLSKVSQWCNVDFYVELLKIGYKECTRHFQLIIVGGSTHIAGII